VVRFRPRRDDASAPRPGLRTGAETDLSAYARTPEDPGEYRHRMAVNAAVLLFVIVLMGIAIWLADSIADMRRNQDCVLSGRRGCTPVEYNHNVR
jgi:hypothetical protein